MFDKKAKDDLTRSGISEEEAKHAEMEYIEDASQIDPSFDALPAILIQYVNPWTDEFETYIDQDGKEVSFTRVRYLEQPKKAKGFTKQKPRRYGQPKDSGVHAYFPVIDGLDWDSIRRDTKAKIIITEGEKKSLKLGLAGYTPIGLGGVWNFTQNKRFLDVLDDIDWYGRTVNICFDSDAASNPKIKHAIAVLVTELSQKRGALVHNVVIPEEEDGSKMGADDYIVKYGTPAFDKLVEDTFHTDAQDLAVLKMNTKVAWIDDDKSLVDLATGKAISPQIFKEGNIFSSVTYMALNAKLEPVKKYMAPTWLKHPNALRLARREFRPETLDDMVNVDGEVVYNRFKGLDPVKGPVTPGLKLIDYIFSGEDEPQILIKFFLDLLAWKVRNLDKLPGIQVMLVGGQGSGKSTLTDLVRAVFHPYSENLQAEDVSDDKNNWIETALFAVMAETEEKVQKAWASKIKALITDDRTRSREMFVGRKEVQNYCFFMSSSNDLGSSAKEKDDRRSLIIRTPATHPDGRKFYGPIKDWIRDGGGKFFLHYLLERDLGDWTPPSKAPDTREKHLARKDNETPVQTFAGNCAKANIASVSMWMKMSQQWADDVLDMDASSQTEFRTAKITKMALEKMTIRPFYTKDELSKVIVSQLQDFSALGAKNMTAKKLSKDLRQAGLQCLKLKGSNEGFKYEGTIQDFLIIAEQSDWRKPITQQEFDDYMDGCATIKEGKAKRKKETQRRSKR